MRVRRVICLAIGLLALSSAGSTELSVDVTDSRGDAVTDAVVSVVSTQGAGAAPMHAPAAQTRIIDQKNETFIPYVEIFRTGDSVVFRNSDTTRHHVYSFAPARQFEFVLTSGQSSPALQLDQAGVVAVGCNIHDQMITYLYISDAPWIAHSDAKGRVHFAGLPEGDFQVRVWHPQLRPGRPDPAQSVHVGNSANPAPIHFSLSLLPDPRARADRERANY